MTPESVFPVAASQAAPAAQQASPTSLAAQAAVPYTDMAEARMVQYTAGKFVAFGAHVTQELLENPAMLVVPGSAYYAYGLVQWQSQWIPLISLEALARAYPLPETHAVPKHALVLAYQLQPGDPLQYGAIGVLDIPFSHMVSDQDASALPDDSDIWEQLALSCFQYQGHQIPILDSARLFEKYLG